MRILVTGGCGNIGTHLVDVMSKKGYELRVIDKDAEGLKKLAGPNVETRQGDISDKNFINDAVNAMDAVVHLAWSFSDNPIDLFNIDVQGYIHLLDACVKNGVDNVVNTSTAVVYGKPQYSPVDERHPKLVEQARKRMYALAKLATEKLSEIYALEHNLAANNVMIWYAYGYEIGGKHIRGMIKEAIQKGAIQVPKDCGGSFLQLDDLITGLEGIFRAKPRGELFNLATVYLTWEELAEIIVEKANPEARVIAVPREEWKGSTFLTDDWEFSTQKAENMLGYRSHLSKDAAIKHLGNALEACVAEVK